MNTTSFLANWTKNSKIAVIINLGVFFALFLTINYIILSDLRDADQTADSVSIVVLLLLFASATTSALISGLIAKLDKYTLMIPFIVISIYLISQTSFGFNQVTRTLAIGLLSQIIIILFVIQLVQIKIGNLVRLLIKPFDEETITTKATY